MKKFGDKLRALRIQRGMTLIEVARALAYTTHGYLSELESGRKQPTAEFVLKVARYFDVTTDELLKDEMSLNRQQITRSKKRKS